MKKVFLLILLMSAIFVLNACQTSELDIVPNSQAKTPVREIPMDVMADYIAPNALVPLVVNIDQGNLFDNGDFESGLAGWTGCEAGAIAESSDAYEGSKALKVNAGNCFYRSIEVTAGDELILSCYARLQSGSAWTGMGLGFADANWTSIPGGPSTIITGSSYQRYDVEATAPVGSKYVSMWMYSDNPAVVDECSLMLEQTPPPPPAPSGDNLLDNADFDFRDYSQTPTVLRDWTAGCGGYVQAFTTNPSTNERGVRLRQGACLDQSLSASDIEQLKGKDFTYSCLVGSNATYASMSIYLDGEAISKTIPLTTSVSPVRYDFVEITGTASQISSGFVSLYAEGEGEQYLMVDKCSLTVDGAVEPPVNPSGDNLLVNGAFESLDANNKPNNWLKGCGGSWTSVAGRSAKGLKLENGVCIDQTLSSTAFSQLSGKNYKYSCYAKNTGGYASITLFLDGQPESVVIPASNSYQLVELTGTAGQVSGGFVSIYSEAGLTVDDCSLVVVDGNPTQPVQPGTQQWLDSFGDGVDNNFRIRESVLAIESGTAGTYYAISRLVDGIYARKYDVDGNLLFPQALNVGISYKDAATDSNGNLYILRTSREPTDQSAYSQLNLLLDKYDSSGNQLFTKTILSQSYYVGSSSGYKYVGDMVISSDAIYINGSLENSVYKFDLSGELQWSALASAYAPGDLATTPDGSAVYVSTMGYQSRNSTLYKLNTNDGSQVWQQQLFSGDPGNARTQLVADNSHVYVMGSTLDTFSNESTDRSDGYLWKYDSAGNQIWTNQYATNLSDRLASADLYDGALYTTGIAGPHSFINKINLETAAVEWAVDLEADSYDVLNDIVVDATGIYAGGYVAVAQAAANGQTVAGSSDAYIVKYSLP